ncbi:hypothetical protein KR222_010426 [Zaprionus bogoriensis]|nr:hypothetical protein KR222_010426 [Zaprionus bogoriensis]
MDTTAVFDTKLDAFRKFNLLEKHRVDSFKDWPFSEKSAMAEAGFYWTGTKRENDTATCFVCGKTLDGWESGDDPWKEHLKHAPQCDFVKMGRPEADMTVEQFLELFGTVMKNNIEKNIKEFKTHFTKQNEAKLEDFLNNKS